MDRCKARKRERERRGRKKGRGKGGEKGPLAVCVSGHTLFLSHGGDSLLFLGQHSECE